MTRSLHKKSFLRRSRRSCRGNRPPLSRSTRRRPARRRLAPRRVRGGIRRNVDVENPEPPDAPAHPFFTGVVPQTRPFGGPDLSMYRPPDGPAYPFFTGVVPQTRPFGGPDLSMYKPPDGPAYPFSTGRASPSMIEPPSFNPSSPRPSFGAPSSEPPSFNPPPTRPFKGPDSSMYRPRFLGYTPHTPPPFGGRDSYGTSSTRK
jgi:hypothetical protein